MEFLIKGCTYGEEMNVSISYIQTYIYINKTRH